MKFCADCDAPENAFHENGCPRSRLFENALLAPFPDNVNSPSHYRWLPVEVIDVTEHLNFCLGNVIKYVLRADHKGKPVEDLEKARWYLDREIKRRSVEKH